MMFLLLLFGHVLADYPLQGDFMARAKNRFIPIQGVPALTILVSHALVHAGFVLLITGSLYFAIIELVTHSLIDDLKCEGKLSFNQDQLLHVGCKAAYVLALMVG
jgi:hypothetical protein